MCYENHIFTLIREFLGLFGNEGGIVIQGWERSFSGTCLQANAKDVQRSDLIAFCCYRIYYIVVELGQSTSAGNDQD
jgi:hypothetical protein